MICYIIILYVKLKQEQFFMNKHQLHALIECIYKTMGTKHVGCDPVFTSAKMCIDKYMHKST